jgi:hypothetical protein
MTRLWAKRDGQIQSVIESTVGMYGDLQGIAGMAIQEINELEMPLLEERNNCMSATDEESANSS